MKYRADIDGLRAVAVVPILLFHAGISTLSGGFIGVDVFFVISGFLITTIIFREMAADRFSIASFYRRRMVRIFPALFTMLIIVLIAGCLVLFPSEVRQLGYSAAATSVFGSNLFFYAEASYFAPSSESMPLLHTWSLGVEEQFYIFYPILLILVRKYLPKRVLVVLAGVALVSFAIGALLAAQQPRATFYLLPGRAWELALGGLVALGGFPPISRPAIRTVAALAGLAMIAAGYFVIRADMGFPVPWALLPCFGAALLIAYGEGTPAGGLLATSPFRWIGKISYSLYLWHWPIITFYRIETGYELAPLETALLIVASFVLAVLSYLCVERPALTGFAKVPLRKVLLAGGAALAGMTVCALVVAGNSAGWRRLDPAVARIASYSDYWDRADYTYQFLEGTCFRGGKGTNAPFDPGLCLSLAKDRPNILVFGDSHAAQYWRAISLRYPDRNVMQATFSGCRPLLHSPGPRNCREVIDYVLGPLLQKGGIDTVIIGGRWRHGDLPALRATVDRIRASGAKAVLVGPTIEYQGEFPLALARAMTNGTLDSLASLREADRPALDAEMARRFRSSGAAYVSVIGIECPEGACRTVAPDGGPMQFDYGHLTQSGATWVVSRMPAL